MICIILHTTVDMYEAPMICAGVEAGIVGALNETLAKAHAMAAPLLRSVPAEQYHTTIVIVCMCVLLLSLLLC